MALPPLLTGATQFALTEVPVTDAVTDVGTPGVLGTVAAENDADHDDGDVPDHAVHRAKRFDALHLYFDVLRHHGRSHYSTPSREDGLARANREEEARLLGPAV